MLLKEIKAIYHKELDVPFGTHEVSSFFYLLIGHFLNLERFVLALQPELVVTKENETLLFKAMSDLKQHIPIQYIIGETEFMDFTFKVSLKVLIPRPETEDLVRWIVEDYQGVTTRDFRILDIGTGSGCIAISVAKHLEGAKVSALDISSDALDSAKSNAALNEVHIDFYEGDILDGVPTLAIESNFDIIISNPPYVRELEKKEMSENVLEHEPDIALFVSDKDPLVFYRAIANFAKENLSDDGALYLEINQYLGNEMIALLNEYNFKDIELRKDIFGNDRMVKAVFRG